MEIVAAAMMGFFLWLSDLHLDPYYGQKGAVGTSNSECSANDSIASKPYGLVGCDAPLSLIEETLKHVANFGENENSKNPDFVLITGDFARHATETLDDPIQETKSILRSLNEAIQSYFPSNSTADENIDGYVSSSSISVIPALGNNDVTPDYYLDLTDTTNTNEILQMALSGLYELFRSDQEIETFSRGGYFARNISDNLTVISLNTVMYSINHQPAWQTSPLSPLRLDDPMGQFAWMKEELHLASKTGRAVYMVGHIPPSIGSFRHSQFWHDHYLDQYFEILQEAERDFEFWNNQNNRQQLVVAHLFGHLHSEEFRLLTPTPMRNSTSADQASGSSSDNDSAVGNTKLPLLIASSITPVYGANPSYRLVEYHEGTAAILDYQTFYLDLKRSYSIDNHDSEGVPSKPFWTTLPAFTETYHVQDLSANSLDQILSKMSAPIEDSKSLWDVFLSRQDVYASQEFNYSVDDSSDTDVEEGVDCDDWCRREWLCTLQAISQHQFAICLEERTPSQTPWSLSPVMARSIVAVVSILVATSIFWGFKRHLKRRHYQRQPHQSQNQDEDEEADCGHIETFERSIGTALDTAQAGYQVAVPRQSGNEIEDTGIVDGGLT